MFSYPQIDLDRVDKEYKVVIMRNPNLTQRDVYVKDKVVSKRTSFELYEHFPPDDARRFNK